MNCQMYWQVEIVNENAIVRGRFQNFFLTRTKNQAWIWKFDNGPGRMKIFSLKCLKIVYLHMSHLRDRFHWNSSPWLIYRLSVGLSVLQCIDLLQSLSLNILGDPNLVGRASSEWGKVKRRFCAFRGALLHTMLFTTCSSSRFLDFYLQIIFYLKTFKVKPFRLAAGLELLAKTEKEQLLAE